MNKTVYPVICRQTELPFYLTEAAVYDPVPFPERVTAGDRYTFIFTANGSGRFFAGDTGYALKKGSIVYLAPGTAYRYETEEPGAVTQRFVFGGDSAVIRGLVPGASAVKTEVFLGDCSRIFSDMFRIAEDPVNGGEDASLLIYGFILAARRIFAGQGRESVLYGNPADEALRYIGENYMRELTLEMLAGLTGVTLQHFCRVFRDRTGMRPMEYIAKKRISEAKKLLECSDMQIQDIGQAVGIADRNYFGIIFRKYEGMTPSEYRRQRQV